MDIEQRSRLYDDRFVHPATHYVSGPTGAGKTRRICQLIRSKHLIMKGGANISNIIFYYDSWQDEYEKMKEDFQGIKFINKKPTSNDFVEKTHHYKHKGGSIVVIDDMMSHLNEDIDQIFRVSSRHNNVSVFLLVQSLFPPQKMARQISLNSRYFHLHKNPREKGQITYFARQINPSNIKFVAEVFDKVTSRPYGCLLIDMTQECDEKLRYRYNYLPEEGYTLVCKEKGL